MGTASAFRLPGARQDAFAYGASGLKDMLTGLHTRADLGYAGVDGIDLIPIKRRSGQAEPDPDDASFNLSLAAIRTAVERAVAQVKTWRILSEEAGRFRPPLKKLAAALAVTTGLLNLRRIPNPTFG
jgi:DDE superfamily endonuclease